MGVKVRVKRNIGKDSEEYFGKPNGKVYELTDKFELKDDDGYVWGRDDGFKNEQEFIEHMKDVSYSSTEFEVVESDYFKLTTPSSSKKSIHITFDGETTRAVFKEDGKVVKREKVGYYVMEMYMMRLLNEFEVVDEENKMNKFKVGDIVVVDGVKTGLEFNNDKGKIVEVDNHGDIGVEFDTKKSSALHSCADNGKRNSCWYVDEDMVTVPFYILK